MFASFAPSMRTSWVRRGAFRVAAVAALATTVWTTIDAHAATHTGPTCPCSSAANANTVTISAPQRADSTTTPDILLARKSAQLGTGGMQSYTVQEGDTLEGIAKKLRVGKESLVEKNPSVASDPNLLIPGAKLHVFSPFGPGLTLDLLPSLPKAAPATFSPVWPASGTITTNFGEVGETSPRGHAGLDIAGPTGTRIVASEGGKVVRADWDGNGYGGLVVIAHPSGHETWYAHLDTLGAKQGDAVQRGQEIGTMGSTGYSTGPHLHFEVRKDGALLNPSQFLPMRMNA